MTATVETVSEQLDLASIIPADKVVSAVTRAITLSETDIGTNFIIRFPILIKIVTIYYSNSICSTISASSFGRNKRTTRFRFGRRGYWFLADFYREIQIFFGRFTWTNPVHSPTTNRTFQGYKTGYPLLYAQMLKRSNTLWRCLY